MGVVELRSSFCALSVSVSFSHNSRHVLEVSQSFFFHLHVSGQSAGARVWFTASFHPLGFSKGETENKEVMYMFVCDVWSVCGRLVVTSVRPCTRDFVGCWNEKYSFCTFLDRVQLFLHTWQVRRRRTEGRKNQRKKPTSLRRFRSVQCFCFPILFLTNFVRCVCTCKVYTNCFRKHSTDNQDDKS